MTQIHARRVATVEFERHDPFMRRYATRITPHHFQPLKWLAKFNRRCATKPQTIQYIDKTV